MLLGIGGKKRTGWGYHHYHYYEASVLYDGRLNALYNLYSLDKLATKDLYSITESDSVQNDKQTGECTAFFVHTDQ